MVATTTSATSANDNEHARHPWTPDANDHLIFQWVIMQGKTQDSVATMLGISQPTVSRIIQRYERWQAHAREREGGRLDHCERLRAQRWLTFERNEVLLASCLRIANEMEGFTDVSKSTIRRGASISQELEVSTQHATIDRSGVAARFLRLAFRINMEQLKLAELDPPPPAEPFSADELAELDRDAAADAEEIFNALRRASEPLEESSRDRGTHEVGQCPVAPPEPQAQEDAESPSVATGSQGRRVHERSEMHLHAEPERSISSAADSCTLRPAVEPAANETTAKPASDAASLHNMNNLHNTEATEFGATPTELCSCLSQPPSEKNSPPPCIPDKGQSPWSGADRTKGAKRRRATSAAE